MPVKKFEGKCFHCGVDHDTLTVHADMWLTLENGRLKARIDELEKELRNVQELSLKECGIGFVDMRVLTPNKLDEPRPTNKT